MNRDRGPGPVPDRWLNCPRRSTNLIGGKFLAFKTPLDSRFDSQVPPAHRFTPSMLFETTKNYKWRIGLWMDLTNTQRFYNKDEVVGGYEDDREVGYVKVACRGHGETPSVDQTRLFVNVCQKFIQKNPLDVIGVHCTHGFNRTGFLIVAYLVEEMDWSVDAAILEFAKYREPGIYKADYLEVLYERYNNDADFTPSAPPRPGWCLENGRESDGEDNDSSRSQEKRPRNHSSSRESGGRKRFKREGNGSTDGKIPQFVEGVNGVNPVLDQPRLGKLQRTAQKMCGWTSSGFPGSQPVSMDKKNIKLLEQKPYRVSWKADGTRYMMLILKENEVYMLDRDNAIFEVSGLRFVHRKNINEHLNNTLLDGEMVIDRHEGNDIPRYLVYDIIRVNNMDVMHMKFFPERLAVIDLDVIKPRHRAMIEGKIDKICEPFSVRAKDFFPVEKAERFLGEKFSRQLTHEPDGLIFQPSADPYTPGQSLNVLKWKPPSLNSIDFRLKIVKEEGMGILTKKVGQLYVGSLDQPFAVMKNISAVKEYDGKIIECSFNNGNWVFMRERTDKSFPNGFRTATAVMESIRNPVTKEYLFQVIERNRYDLMPPPEQPNRR